MAVTAAERTSVFQKTWMNTELLSSSRYGARIPVSELKLNSSSLLSGNKNHRPRNIMAGNARSAVAA